MTPLRDLLARCEKATGSDNPDLARDLCKAFIHRDDYPTIGTLIADALTGPERWQLGSAVALAEHMFPGCNWIIGRGRTRPDEPLYGAQILREGPIRDEVIGEWELEASAPLALVCALLKSLIAGEEKGRG